MTIVPNSYDFRAALRAELRAAELAKAEHLDVNAGNLHRRLGGYPGRAHRMPTCCLAMTGEQRTGDEILAAPPSRTGASLTIRYRVPR
jgi:5-methylcytosine-specific restriction protein A